MFLMFAAHGHGHTYTHTFIQFFVYSFTVLRRPKGNDGEVTAAKIYIQRTHGAYEVWNEDNQYTNGLLSWYFQNRKRQKGRKRAREGGRKAKMMEKNEFNNNYCDAQDTYKFSAYNYFLGARPKIHEDMIAYCSSGTHFVQIVTGQPANKSRWLP